MLMKMQSNRGFHSLLMEKQNSTATMEHSLADLVLITQTWKQSQCHSRGECRQNVNQSCSHVKACLGLEDLPPALLVYMPGRVVEDLDKRFHFLIPQVIGLIKFLMTRKMVSSRRSILKECKLKAAISLMTQPQQQLSIIPTIFYWLLK